MRRYYIMTATPRLMSNHALDQFQKYLMTHNKSPNTICVYRYAVEQFYHLYPQLTPVTFSFIRYIFWNVTGPRP